MKLLEELLRFSVCSCAQHQTSGDIKAKILETIPKLEPSLMQPSLDVLHSEIVHGVKVAVEHLAMEQRHNHLAVPAMLLAIDQR